MLTQKHATISSISDRVDMRWDFMTLLALVQFNDLLSVDWQTLVRIYNNAEQSGIGLQTIIRASYSSSM